MVSCLTDREVSQWVTPLRDTTVDTDPRPPFVIAPGNHAETALGRKDPEVRAFSGPKRTIRSPTGGRM
jgi:hypothetical protein